MIGVGGFLSEWLRGVKAPNLIESWWKWRDRQGWDVNPAELAQGLVGGPMPLATKLPLDAASRFARANRMGADLSTPYYRAHAGDPAQGVPSHWSRSREHASEFMGRAGFQRTDIDKQLLTGYLLPSRAFDPTKAYPLSDLYAYTKAAHDIYGLGAIKGMIRSGDQKFRSLAEMAQAAKAQPHAPGLHGSAIFDHWQDRFGGRVGLPHSATPMRRAGFDYAINYMPRSPEIVLFNPAVMRLEEAAFDPRRWRSSNWLAGALAAPFMPFDREGPFDTSGQR